MPAPGLYGTLLQPPALYPGDLSINLTTIAGGDNQGAVGGLNTTGNRSDRIAIARGDNDEGLIYISAELIFNGNPGAFNFQIQECHGTDTLGRYVTLATAGTITSAALSPDGTNYIATVDLQTFTGTHVLFFCNTQSANAVKLTSATFSR